MVLEIKGLALLSSGMDCIVALTLAKKGIIVPLALTFDYGQKAAEKEIAMARKVCEHFGIEHRTIKLGWLKEITKTALVEENVEIPLPDNDDLDNYQASLEAAKAVWVPNRNGVMINIAAAFAEARGYDVIITGFNKEEAATFPDNSKAFVEIMDICLEYSTGNGVKVSAPLLDMEKEKIAQVGIEINAPLHLSWSCYLAGEKPCGRCESCKRRQRAFDKAGKKDPLLETMERI